MKVGLLECDHVEGRVANVPGGYREMFKALLEPHVADLAFRYYDACHGVLPAAPGECDAYICSGSRYSVYDERDWIAPLSGFLRKLREARVPFVGICFGHQMLAQALGGQVARAPQGWGVGVHEMSILGKEAWMRPDQPACRLQYMHGDQVLKLPPDAKVLARSEHCEVAMFRVGETMLGIEGHPEFSGAFNGALIRARRDRIGHETADRALAGVNGPTDSSVVGKWIAEFLGRPGEKSNRQD